MGHCNYEKKIFAKVILLGILLVTVFAIRVHMQNWLEVKNESGKAIRILTIEVTHEVIRFGDISDGSTVFGRFQIGSDDHFAVRGELADGTRISANCGYVTNGMSGEQATFVIRPGGKVEFSQSNSLQYSGVTNGTWNIGLQINGKSKPT